MRNASAAQPWAYVIVAILVSALAFYIAFRFVEPPPPSHVTIASGGEGGAYFEFAQEYRDILAREGIDLEVLETAGSVANLELLSDAQSAVDLALLQGGIITESPENLTALASVFIEPIWVFYREDGRETSGADNGDGVLPTGLPSFKGRHIGVGAPGSGTRYLALQLLADNGIDAGNTSL
ncbi:MAG: TAXI family TRAP transporter solute-binding subunit, partial [Kiloniellales bacterium]|nr:TAXI family TRAP transporter solute-binding subunit [Kiloniellales bacterium]